MSKNPGYPQREITNHAPVYLAYYSKSHKKAGPTFSGNGCGHVFPIGLCDGLEGVFNL